MRKSTKVFKRGKALVSVTLLSAMLAGCGNDPDASVATRMVIDMAKTTYNKFFKPKDATAAEPFDLNQTIANALRDNDVPLLLIAIERRGSIAILGPSGENGPYRTWSTADRQALSFKHDVLTSTRGLGQDMMSSQADPAIALIRARQAGQATRVYRFLSGVGHTAVLQMECVITPGGAEKVDFAEVHAQTTIVTEVCQKDTLQVQNLYWVSGAGRIVKSRQWVSGPIGYMTFTYLRL